MSVRGLALHYNPFLNKFMNKKVIFTCGFVFILVFKSNFSLKLFCYWDVGGSFVFIWVFIFLFEYFKI